MDAKIVAVGLVGATLGLYLINGWLVRRANRKYDAEVAAMTARIRAKEEARVEAELDAMIAEGVPRMPKRDRAIPLDDPRHPARRRAAGLPPTPLAGWPTPTAAEMAEAKAWRTRQAARTPANAYDARKALVRHQHESAALPGDPLYRSAPNWQPDTAYGELTVSGSGGSFDGGGASGDWSSPSSDSTTSSDSGSISTSD